MTNPSGTELSGTNPSPTELSSHSRGRVWLDRLSGGGGAPAYGQPSVLSADADLGEESARFVAVAPDPHARFPRARAGEVGLEEGWTLAKLVRDTIAADTAAAAADAPRRPIVAVVDVTSQAYGKREEMLGVHLACAAAADAYAQARLAGHPVIALIVGKAMSGAFLAHGYQANRILALDAPDVLVHAMGKQAAARITRRTVADLDAMGDRFPPMAYDIANYAKLGMLHALIGGVDADQPSAADVDKVRDALIEAVADTRASGRRDLSARLQSAQAHDLRSASIAVRRRLAEQWAG